MDKKINWLNLFNDPINGFSKYIMNNLDEAINNFFENEFKETNPNYNLIDSCEREIKERRSAIQTRKANEHIIGLLFWNGVIFLSFFILIGFCFWKKYKKNQKTIEEFYEFQRSEQNKINELTSIRYNQVFSSFSTITLKDIYAYVFEYFGLTAINNFSQSQLLKLINDPDLIDIYSGITGVIKNSPFYDLVARKLIYQEVAYSQSKSFRYTYTIDGNTHVGYEVLTAYYYERTPFVEEKNLLIYKTNFLPELNVSTNVISDSKYKQSILLENKDFIKYVQIFDYSNKPAALSQFFTIQTQENFVNWYKQQDFKVFNLFKIDDNVVIKNSTYNFKPLKQINKTIDALNICESTKEISIDKVKTKIRNLVFLYFDRLTRMLQLPLLIPGISREWYRKNGKYLIANNSDLEVQEIENIDIIEPIDSIDKFLDPKYFRFKSDCEPKKPIWFTTNKLDIDANKCAISILDMNSFGSDHLYEDVLVHGTFVGPKTIRVKYERFFPIKEKKLLIVLYKSLKTTTTFIIGKFLNNMISENFYSNTELLRDVKQYGIWTNDPSKFEQSDKYSIIVCVAKEFDELNQKYNLEASLRIDELGYYISINNFDAVNQTIIQQLSNMLHKLASSNFYI